VEVQAEFDEKFRKQKPLALTFIIRDTIDKKAIEAALVDRVHYNLRAIDLQGNKVTNSKNSQPTAEIAEKSN
jgi:hypothetical protein